jgi:solute carrier family 12 (sodium/potassium/chloride transporter), member 2
LRPGVGPSCRLVKGVIPQFFDEIFRFRCILKATGIGKLKPNLVLMGYKTDWKMCDAMDLEQYFNVVHKALDMYLAVAILRVPKGLDYSSVLGDEAPKHITEAPRSLPNNDSSADLQFHNKNSSLTGSMDSLSRNVSQGESSLFGPSLYHFVNSPFILTHH